MNAFTLPFNATVLDDKTNKSMMKITEDGNSQTCEKCMFRKARLNQASSASIKQEPTPRRSGKLKE